MEDFIRKFNEKADAAIAAAKKAREDDERRRLMTTVGQDVATLLAPFLANIAESVKFNKDAMGEMMQVLRAEVADTQMRGIDTTPLIAAIETALGGIQLPKADVQVTVPDFKIPDIQMPDQMDIKGWVGLMTNKGEVGYNNPLPVLLIDKRGNPINLFESIPQAITGGGGGGKADFFTIKDIRGSSASLIDQVEGALKVTGNFSVTAAGASSVSLVNADGNYYNTDNPLPVTFSAASVQPVSQVSGAVWSVIVNEIFGSIGTNVINPDGRIKVELPTGSSGLTDTELRASSVPVAQASGAAWSVSVNDVFGSVGTNVINPDGRVSVQLPENPVPVYQVSGSLWSVAVTDIFATTATSSVVNPDNRVKVELPATTVTVSDVTASLKAALVDSTGVQYSGSNPVPVSWVSGAGASTAVHITDSGGVGYSGSNPVPITIVSGAANSTALALTRQTNPTAVASDYVPLAADDLGRQLVRPVQARDLIVTAYVSVTNGTETTLLAASAGSFHDAIMVVGSNNSDAAVSVDIRGVTGGNILHTLRIPANGTAGWAPPVPWPQDATGNNWTIDGPDETGRTITVSALFSREV